MARSEGLVQLRGPMARRRFLRGAGFGVAGLGASVLFGCGGDDRDAPSTVGPDDREPPPEVTTLRVPQVSASCAAPFLAARAFLAEEGFTDIQYVPTRLQYSLINERVGSGEVDIAFQFVPPLAYDIEQGMPLVALAGAHVACYEIRGADGITSLADLRGKRVGIHDIAPKPSDFTFIASILQYVGITVGKDCEIVPFNYGSTVNYTNALNAGLIDAAMFLPPVALSVRDAEIGHVLLDSRVDAPWSKYYCCFVITRKGFLEQNPIATKRALRAVLRGVDRCHREPEAVAQELVRAGWSANEYSAVQGMPYQHFDAWRTHSPEDSMRFFALRLREGGVIKSTPDELIKRGLDLRYLDELRDKIAFAPGRGGGNFALNCDTAPLGPTREGVS